LRIVDLLEKFPRPVPIDFLAEQLGLRAELLMVDLLALEAKGVVKIDGAKRTVGLAQGSSKRLGLSKVAHWFSGPE